MRQRKVGVSPSSGVPLDYQTFREQLQRSKDLALKNYLYHWEVIEV
jgi:hypothetical protein